MILISKIAFRNLLRHFRRTALTVASISFGLAVVLWGQSIMAGRNKHIIESITSTYIGQLQIFHKDYVKDRLLNVWFEGVPANLKETLPPGSRFTPRAHLPALLSSSEQSTPIFFEGIDPDSEKDVTTLKAALREGEFLEKDDSLECDSRQIYLGKAAAELLNLKVGNKVVVLGQAADGSLGNDLFRVKGIFDSGSPQFNKVYAFAPISCVKKVGAIQGIHEVTIQLPFGADEALARQKLAAALPDKLVVTTWREAVPNMAAMVKFNDAMLVMISTILFTVITFGIVNALLMSVFERTREFGIMISLGTTPGQVRSMVVAESLFMGLGSTVIGILLGGLLVVYHQQVGFDLRPFLGEAKSIDNFLLDLRVYPVFQLLPFLKATGITLLFVVAAGLYPALRASRLNPTEAMRVH